MVLSILTERIALYRSAPREARAFPAFLQTLCQFHIEHLIFYTPVILSLGIACYFSLHFEPAASLVFNMWVGSLALLFLCHNLTHQEFRYNKLRVPAYLLCLFISGIFLAQHRTDQVAAPVLQKPLKFADLSGTIRSIDILPEHAGVRLVLNDLVIEDLPAEQTPRTIRLKIRAPLAYRPGQRVTARASLNPPGQMVTPNAFNFQFYSYFKQLGAVGFSYNPPDIISPAPSSFFSGFWESMRLWIAGKITHAMPQSLQGVSITFMTGEKSTIPPDDLAAMRNSGLAHLLAISGLHVGLVAGFIFFLTRLGLACIADWALKYPIKKIAAFVALIFAIFYTCLVGAEVPTQRALMMTGIALFAIMIDRSPFSLRMVALAALVILVFYPESLLSASFQMSFAAVTALVWFYDRHRQTFQTLYRDAGIIKRGLLYILGIATTTLIAGSATTLFGVYHFQSASLYSLLANILAMPVVGLLVMPAAVLSYLFLPIGLEALPLSLMGLGIQWVLYIAHFVSGLDGAVMTFPAFSSLTLGLTTLSCLGIMIGPGILRLAGIAGLLSLTTLSLLHKPMNIILISPEGSLTGFYSESEQTLYVSSLQMGRYERESWESRLGTGSKKPLKFSASPLMQCDTQGCRLPLPSLKIAFPANLYALREDCLWADLVIFPTRSVKQCAAAQVIDRRFLRREGAVRIDIPAGSTSADAARPYRLYTVRQSHGVRPWRNAPQ